MATFTEVDTDQIRQTAQSIQQDIDSLKNIRNALDSDVLSRLAPWWQGEAKDMFTQQFTSYSMSLKALVDEYELMNKELEKAGTEYRAANDQVTAQINRLQ